MAIRVVLVDEDSAAQARFATLLERQPDISVESVLGDAREAVRRACDASPDVVVLEVALPGLGGIEAAKQIHDLCTDGRIVMLSANDGVDYIDRALRVGAKGYVLKDSAEDELVAAVRAVYEGERYLSKDISLKALEAHARQRGALPPLELLTQREFQVLKHLVEGESRNEIARRLGVSARSVDTYRSRLMLKLEVDSLAALVKLAVREGLTTL